MNVLKIIITVWLTRNLSTQLFTTFQVTSQQRTLCSSASFSEQLISICFRREEISDWAEVTFS